MKIENAMKAIVAVQESIAITSPRPMQVHKAWLSAPPQGQLLVASLPCWTNTWDFVGETRFGMLRQMSYLVSMRLHVAQATDGDNSLSAELALAFLDPILTAFGQRNAVTGLGGITMRGDVGGTIVPTVSHQNIRGGSPTLAIFEGAPRTIGLDLVLEVEMSDAFDYS